MRRLLFIIALFIQVSAFAQPTVWGGAKIAVNQGDTSFFVSAGALKNYMAAYFGGTVTSVSVVSANGFAGSVATATTTPAITLSTSITGVLKGNGTAISAATSGTDYSAGTSALATGILKSTTTTGALTIAVAGDFPTLNQSTTGSAATLTTARAIYGNNFDGSAALAQIIASTFGGTGNGFTKFTGPATSEKTFTLPNATATILTDNTDVTVAQGGTGASTLTGILQGNGTSAVTAISSSTTGHVLTVTGANTYAFSAAPGGGATIITPSQITSDQDNYAPTGWSTATIVRVSGDNGIRAITSLSASGLSDGHIKTIINVGSYPVYFPGEHPDGTAANRIAVSEDFFLLPGHPVDAIYDATLTRWTLFGPRALRQYRGPLFSNGFGSVTAGDWGMMTYTFTGTGATGAAVTPIEGVPAGLGLSTGTTSTGLASSMTGKNATQNIGRIDDAHIYVESPVSVPVLSDATNRFTAAVCLSTSSSGVITGNNTFGIRYTDNVNSGKWQGWSKDNAGAESTVDLGITVVADIMYSLRTEINKENSEIRFYLDGVFSGRITANLPASNTSVIPTVTVVKTVGTTARTITSIYLLAASIYP